MIAPLLSRAGAMRNKLQNFSSFFLKYSPFYVLNIVIGTLIAYDMRLYFETPNDMFIFYFLRYVQYILFM